MKYPPENHMNFEKPNNWKCDPHGYIVSHKCDKCDIMMCERCLICSAIIGGNVIDLCKKCMVKFDKLIKNELLAKNEIDMFLYQKS